MAFSVHKIKFKEVRFCGPFNCLLKLFERMDVPAKFVSACRLNCQMFLTNKRASCSNGSMTEFRSKTESR